MTLNELIAELCEVRRKCCGIGDRPVYIVSGDGPDWDDLEKVERFKFLGGRNGLVIIGEGFENN